MQLTKTSIGFIINAQSGTQQATTLVDAIEKIFLPQQFITTICYTNYAGHGTELAKAMVEAKYSIVVAVGGDGTVNEIAQALIHTQTALGIIPKGSGNGLARACGIPLQMDAALQTIHKGYLRTIDAGMANEHLFLSNAGVGFDALITKVIKNETARGLRMYVRKTVYNFFSYKPQKYSITVNNKTYTEKAFMVSVANGNEFGNGFKIAPTATLNDGELDLMIIKPLNIFTAIQVSARALRGNLHTYHKVKYITGTKIKISNDGLKNFQVDGELKSCNTVLNVQILPAALHVVVP